MRVSPIKRKKAHGAVPSGRVTINVARAIRRLDLTPAAVAGRYEARTLSDLFIVNLIKAPGDSEA
jgi:hypothetical protein